MKPILFVVFGIILTGSACSSSKKAASSGIAQGITGRVTEARGNRMPGPGAAPSSPKGLMATVFIYEPTTLSQVSRKGDAPVYTAIFTKQVASVDTDSTGLFTVALPPGSYSLFIKQGKDYYANLFNATNHIALFTVEENKLTKADLVVRTATY